MAIMPNHLIAQSVRLEVQLANLNFERFTSIHFCDKNETARIEI